MKARLAVLAAMAVVALPLAAQGGAGSGMRGPGMGSMSAVPNIDTLATQLSLTAEQRPKVAAAITAFETSTKDAREFLAKAQAGGGMQGMRDNPDFQKHMTALREGRTKLATDIKAAVTAEQGAKYDELYPQRRRPQGQ
jgi:Spy/CpxP family protein refolding chaperone